MTAVGLSPGAASRKFAEAREGFDLILGSLDANPRIPASHPVGPDFGDPCFDIWEHRDFWGEYGKLLLSLGLLDKTLGAVGAPDARLSLRPTAGNQSIGIHGYADYEITKPTFMKFMAKLTETVGDAGVAIASYVFGRVRFCTTLAATCQGQATPGPACQAEGFTGL